ncbi:unnamed protein product, partial [Closterium sp. NIES-54]
MVRLVTMLGAVGDAGVVDTLEARLEDARKRHEANEYGPNVPLAVIEVGIRSVWAEEHPARPASPRPVNNEGGIDVGVNADGDQVGSSAGGTSRQRSVIHADEVGGVQPQLEMVGLIGFARGTVATPEEHYSDLRAEFCAVQLLTFTVISRCCSPGMQIALKWCREYLDAGQRAWHFIESTYQVTDALYIGQLEEQLSHILMGEEETATDYRIRARRILTTMRMAGVHYATTSYLTHIMKGLTSTYNLLKRLSLVPSTRATLNKDSLTSYNMQDEAMQEAERPLELLAHSGGGGSSGWKLTEDAEKKKSANDSGRGGGSQRRECWLCGDPNHLSFECPDCSDSDDDDAKGGRGRSGSRRPRRGRNRPRKVKQSTKSLTSVKDPDSSTGGKGRD